MQPTNITNNLPPEESPSPRYDILDQIAPELDVDYWIDAKGKISSFKLADHKNKWIMLNYFQAWCDGCHKYGFPTLKKVSDAFAGSDKIAFAVVQTVFEGSPDQHPGESTFNSRQYDLKVHMGHDPQDKSGHPKIMIDYRTGGTPWVVVIDPNRRVVLNNFHVDGDKLIKFLKQQIT